MRNRSQLVLPIELGVKIAEDDPVRKLIEICEELNYTKLYEKYVRKWRRVSPETFYRLLPLRQYRSMLTLPVPFVIGSLIFLEILLLFVGICVIIYNGRL